MSALRFRDLETGHGTAVGPSALGEWYNSVRDKPIGSFSVDDLYRCCRQELHLRHVMPVVTGALKKDPLAGCQYDGELASAVCRISRRHSAEITTAVRVIADLLREKFDEFDEDIQEEIAEFLSPHSSRNL